MLLLKLSFLFDSNGHRNTYRTSNIITIIIITGIITKITIIIIILTAQYRKPVVWLLMNCTLIKHDTQWSMFGIICGLIASPKIDDNSGEGKNSTLSQQFNSNTFIKIRCITEMGVGVMNHPQIPASNDNKMIIQEFCRRGYFLGQTFRPWLGAFLKVLFQQFDKADCCSNLETLFSI